MKKKNLWGIGVGAALALTMAFAVPVQAWGPERTTYTMAKPADHAVFNSITDNAGVGDERDFVRISEKSSGIPYSSDIEVSPDKQYEVYIYYHNDASATYNSSKYNYIGVARGTRLSSSFPTSLAKGQSEAVWGKITSTSTDPEAVWDEAYVTATADMTLHYVTGSAKIYNSWDANGSVLSTNLFSDTGTFLGLNELNGLILGCDEYAGYVTYTIQTYAVEGSGEGPTTEDTPTQPELEIPKELPSTGPAEIFLAVALVILVVAGIVYWTKTHKAVKKMTKKAKGRR